MINSFKDKDTLLLFGGEAPQKIPNTIHNVAMRKLAQLNNAITLNDMRIPPGNQLEKLMGNRSGQWSVRINDQWRVCFRWNADDAGPHEVEIVDYH